MPSVVQPFGALAIDMLKALGVPHTQIKRVVLDISAQQVPVLTITRFVDSDDMQTLMEVVERYKITGTAEPQP